MLFNLTPDRSVTGGAWYSDQDFESEFVEVLNQQCFKFLQQKAENAEKDVCCVFGNFIEIEFLIYDIYFIADSVHYLNFSSIVSAVSKLQLCWDLKSPNGVHHLQLSMCHIFLLI